MNFKIENNYINITNYPYLEEHFERRAREGWMIKKIIGGFLFIYKKVEPMNLDFSISPYEVETFFSRKSKADLEEFQTVSKYVGWNFATKTYDLHIYYKNRDDKALDLETDEEETFNTLERIAKRYEKSNYLLLVLMLYYTWQIIFKNFNTISAMKDGLQQILVLMLPLGIFLSIYHLIDLNRFLKINRENIEAGLALEFDKKNKKIYQVLFSIFFLALVIFVSYAFYHILILKSKALLIGLIPVVLGTSFGLLYKFAIKSWKKDTGSKVLIFILGTLVTIFITVNIGMIAIDLFLKDGLLDNPENYKLLTIDDLPGQTGANFGEFRQDSSLLVPISYEYSSYNKKGYVRAEYSKALNESLATSLVQKYIKRSEDYIINHFSYDTDYYLEKNIYHDRFESYGITKEVFNRIKNDDLRKAKDEMIKISQERSIILGDRDQWGLDEVYFLNFSKDEIVLRKGKEVFLLIIDDLIQEDLNFSDEDLIKLVKNRLDLNKE